MKENKRRWRIWKTLCIWWCRKRCRIKTWLRNKSLLNQKTRSPRWKPKSINKARTSRNKPRQNPKKSSKNLTSSKK